MLNQRTLGALCAADQIKTAGEVFARSWGNPGEPGHEVRLFIRRDASYIRGGDHAAHVVWWERDGNPFPEEVIAAVHGLESWRAASPETLRLIGPA